MHGKKGYNVRGGAWLALDTDEDEQNGSKSDVPF